MGSAIIRAPISNLIHKRSCEINATVFHPNILHFNDVKHDKTQSCEMRLILALFNLGSWKELRKGTQEKYKAFVEAISYFPRT